MTLIMSIVGLVLMSALAYPIQEDTHWPRWYVFHLIAAFFIGHYYAKKYHLSLGLLTAVVFWSGANVFSGRTKYDNIHQIAQLDLSNMAAKATLAFFILLFIGDKLKTSQLRSLLSAYIIICVVHSVLSLGQLFILDIHIEKSVGFFPNVSMGPNILAVLLPILVFKSINNKLYFIPIALFIFNIYIFRSSMGWLTAISSLSVLALIWLTKRFSLKVGAMITIGLSSVLMYLGRYIDGSWMSKIDRFEMWSLFISWWQKNAEHFLGTGPGTFRNFGPTIQIQNGIEDRGLWLWVHSDWIQIIFETGLVGGFAALWLIMVCIVKNIQSKNYEILTVLIGYLTMCFGNYPLRLAEYSFLGMILIALSLKNSEHEMSREITSCLKLKCLSVQK